MRLNIQHKTYLLAASVVIVAAICVWLTRRGTSGRNFRVPKPEHELLTILGVTNPPATTDGRWHPSPKGGQTSQGDTGDMEHLRSLPYLQGYETATGEKNVTVWDSDLAYDGVNFFTSGHEPAAFITDMEGKVLHKWQFKIEEVWPEVTQTVHSTFWRRALPYPNGDILAIFEGIGLIKLNRRSKLLWAFRAGCHHEAFVADDDRIYVLTRWAEIIPRISPDIPTLVDGIAILSSKGRLLKEYSLLQCFENSDYRGLLKGIKKGGDVFHTNTIHVFDGKQAHIWEHFKRGNILISLRQLDVLAIVDLGNEKVVWAHSGRADGMWLRQHDPNLLANGNILLFDNRGNKGKSRVTEFSPRTMEVAWQYTGGTKGDLYSKTCGVSRRLRNGNTLITESDSGRAFELTPDKETVWEFFNPHRTGNKKQLIATLFEVLRYDRDFFLWLKL